MDKAVKLSEPDGLFSIESALSESERHRVLVEWNRTHLDYPRDKCLHQLFEEQVERTPEATALVFHN